MKKIIWFMAIMALTYSCKNASQPPEFKRVANVKVAKVSGKEAVLNGDAFFYNPNKASMLLRKVEIDVFLKDKRIGVINQALKTKIPGQSEFKVPVDATFDIGDIGLLNGIMSILGGKKMKVRYVGKIKLKIYGVPVAVPIDYEDEIKLRL
ncbi:MAG: LEA type 2 family protein [Bacteroidota bacterium]